MAAEDVLDFTTTAVDVYNFSVITVDVQNYAVTVEDVFDLTFFRLRTLCLDINPGPLAVP